MLRGWDWRGKGERRPIVDGRDEWMAGAKGLEGASRARRWQRGAVVARGWVDDWGGSLPLFAAPQNPKRRV